MSERPEASHHVAPAGDAESGVTDAVTPDLGVAQPGKAPAGADPGATAQVDEVDSAAEGGGPDATTTEDNPTGASTSPAEELPNDLDDLSGDAPRANDLDADDLDAGDVNTDHDINTEAVNDPAEHDVFASGATSAGPAASAHPDTRLAAERLEDLQRLQAEYINYKRRVDRDRALVQERAIADVLDSMLPVLDDIHAAREHGDLTEGPFAAIAEKLEGSLGKFGLERFGAVGDTFDPTVHEALLHQAWDSSITPADPEATTIVLVLQPGYRTGDHIIRPARVAVADPS